ncbi:MAG: flap endonuclease-1 [Nanoarchaeota archaeon]
MGVQLTELLARKPLEIKELSGKIIAIDAYNQLYQFLTSIRQPDGQPLTDSKGEVTSHLVGLFSRTTHLMQEGLKLCFVFDGEAPKLKAKERERRKEIKLEAEKRLYAATQAEDVEGMRKYAARTSRLTQNMVAEARELVQALGLPAIDAPSEGEAQAAALCADGKAFAVASQDADALLFGAPLVVRNLSFSGRKRLPGKAAFEPALPEFVSLGDTLAQLRLTQEQLIALAMLIGTDYNIGGIKGTGPRKGLALVQKHGNDLPSLFAEAKWDECFSTPWNEVFEQFQHMPVHHDMRLSWERIDVEKVSALLVEKHDFKKERVTTTLGNLTKPQQKGLGAFFS